MNVLAIEVSQREGGVALRSDGAEHEARIGPPDPDRDQLLPAIDAIFRAAGASPASLTAVIVSCGPGGFTGLRMAVAAAKALSLATGCRLVALPSAVVAARSAFEAESACSAGRAVMTTLSGGATMAAAPTAASFAVNALASGTPGGAGAPGASGSPDAATAPPEAQAVLVALAGKGLDAWISRVVRRRSPGEGGADRSAPVLWHAVEDASIMDADAFERLVREHRVRTLLADAHLPSPIAARAASLGMLQASPRFSPRACLAEGCARLEGAAGGGSESLVSVDELMPIYPREPEAVRLWRQRSARAAATRDT